MNLQEKHSFAFFVHDLSKIITLLHSPLEYTIKNQDLLHRIIVVLRMKEGNFFYAFDDHIHIYAQLLSMTKKEFRFIVKDIHNNSILTPTITLYLPLLKKTALEEAVYNATESGVTTIQLITTHKSLHSLSSHELERLQKNIISAAEQAKNFSFPHLKPPCFYEDAIKETRGKKIWFDKDGSSFFNCILETKKNPVDHFSIFIGPEGDFTEYEKATIINAGFNSYTLTPTTLRSVSATMLSIGIIRSLI